MLIATVSAKGAPGVSVASLAWTLAWPRPVLLAECEPRGSDFQVGYAHDRAGGGRDLLAVHMNSKRGAAMDTAVREQVLQLGIEESKWLLLGIPEPQQAAAIDWPRLGRTLSSLDGVDVIADCGAVSSVSAPRPVWAAADLVLLLLRSTAASVRAAQLVIPRLRTDLNELGMGADRLAAVVIGPGRPYSLGEVKAALRPASVVEGPEIPVVPVHRHPALGRGHRGVPFHGCAASSRVRRIETRHASGEVGRRPDRGGGTTESRSERCTFVCATPGIRRSPRPDGGNTMTQTAGSRGRHDQR